MAQASHEAEVSCRSPIGRDLAQDGLRTIAAFAIVLQHAVDVAGASGATWTQPVWAATRFALPVFFAVSGLLHSMKGPLADESAWLRRRVLRLLWPWLIWSPLYILRPVLAGQVFGESRYQGGFAEFVVQNLTGGGGLWFFPHLIVVTCIAWLLPNDRARGALGVLALGVWVVFGASLQGIPLLSGTYWAFLPMYLGVYLLGYSSTRLPRAMVLPVSVLGLALLAGSAAVVDVSPHAATTLSAVAGLALTAGLPASWLQGATSAIGSIALFRSASLGLYVIHPLVLAVLLRAMDTSVVSPAGVVAAWALTIVVSLLTLPVLRRIPVIRHGV